MYKTSSVFTSISFPLYSLASVQTVGISSINLSNHTVKKSVLLSLNNGNTKRSVRRLTTTSHQACMHKSPVNTNRMIVDFTSTYRLQASQTWNRGSILGRNKKRVCLFSRLSSPALGPVKPPMKWATGRLFPNVRWTGPETQNWPPSSAKVEAERSYIFTPSNTFVAYTSTILTPALLPLSYHFNIIPTPSSRLMHISYLPYTLLWITQKCKIWAETYSRPTDF